MTAQPTPDTAPTRHSWLTLVSMTGSLSMIMLDQTVVTVALPTMTRELPLSPSGQQWVVNADVVAMAATVARRQIRGQMRPGHHVPRRCHCLLRCLHPVRPRPARFLRRGVDHHRSRNPESAGVGDRPNGPPTRWRHRSGGHRSNRPRPSARRHTSGPFEPRSEAGTHRQDRRRDRRRVLCCRGSIRSRTHRIDLPAVPRTSGRRPRRNARRGILTIRTGSFDARPLC